MRAIPNLPDQGSGRRPASRAGERQLLSRAPRSGTFRRPPPIRKDCLVAVLCFGLFWSAATPGSGLQLPPEVLLDQLLLRAERLIEADDLDAAVEAMDEASALAAEHELELPPDFRFEQAGTAFAVGLLGAAKESVTEYLTVAGREAESYLEAVALLEDVDRILERRDAPECSPLPEGSTCWMELHQPSRVLRLEFRRAARRRPRTWTGECSAGFAQGPGTADLERTLRAQQEHEASRRFGQPHGPSVIRDDSDGGVSRRAVPVREAARAVDSAVFGWRCRGGAIPGREEGRPLGVRTGRWR